MNKSAAFYALQMKVFMAIVPVYKLIASTCALPDYHFFNDTLLLKFVKSAVNRSCAYRVTLLFQVANNVRCTYMGIVFLEK